MSGTKEKDTTIYPKDIELMKYMLEGAEITFDEINDDVPSLLLNGLIFRFTEDGMLDNIERDYND